MEALYVYILECIDNSYYIGVTNDYEKRFCEHQDGIYPTCYTFNRRPVKLVHLESFDTKWDAFDREKQLKRWGRKKKKALIESNEENLQLFAKRKNTQRKILKNPSRPSSYV